MRRASLTLLLLGLALPTLVCSCGDAASSGADAARPTADSGPASDVSSQLDHSDGLPAVEKLPPPTNTTCATAKLLSFSGSPAKAVERADTTGVADEFGAAIDCGKVLAFDGPQVYYRIHVDQGKSYRLELTPSFAAQLYYFPASAACNAAAIQAACSAGTRTGNVTDTVFEGKTGSTVLNPGAAGDYIVVIDSTGAEKAGIFTLVATEVANPTNQTCATAQSLTLSGTPESATVSGDTTAGTNEFGSDILCGKFSPFEGPQAYYRVKLTGAKNYSFVLKPSFPAYMYLFPASAGCTAAGIESACASEGATGTLSHPVIEAGAVGSMVFRPAATGDYLLAVDSTKPEKAGTFTLTVGEVGPAKNATCATAETLSVSGSPPTASATADTSSASNEFGTSITCGEAQALLGPQLYYRLSCAAGKSYKISLQPAFNAALYTFPASAGCAAQAISQGCGSGGTSGMLLPKVSAGGAAAKVFRPATAGDYLIAVDSISAAGGGLFTLDATEFSVPAHAECANAKAIPLTSSPLIIQSDTVGVPNQFGTSITCDWIPGYTYSGGQLYFRVTLQAGKTYTIEATPSSDYDLGLYAFTDLSCTAATIESQCTKDVSDYGLQGEAEKLTLSPTATADYIIAVDSFYASDKGSGFFTLKISW